MPDILVRGLDEQTIKRLKARAKASGRSLQKESKLILEGAANAADVAALLDEWRERFRGRKFSGSAPMIRRDRNR